MEKNIPLLASIAQTANINYIKKALKRGKRQRLVFIVGKHTIDNTKLAVPNAQTSSETSEKSEKTRMLRNRNENSMLIENGHKRWYYHVCDHFYVAKSSDFRHFALLW